MPQHTFENDFANTTNWPFTLFHDIASVLIGSDLLRLCREDLIQICGTADGIRLYNALQAKYVIFS